MLKRTSDIRNDRSVSNSGSKNHLMKTTPNINTKISTPNPPRKTEYKPPVRPVNSSHQINNNTNSRNNAPYRPGNTRRSNDSGSVRSAST